jgi:hypothetical protein
MRSLKMSGGSTERANSGSDPDAEGNTPGSILMGGTQFLSQSRPLPHHYLMSQQTKMVNMLDIPASAAQELVVAETRLPPPRDRYAPTAGHDGGLLWTSAASPPHFAGETSPQQHVLLAANSAALPVFLDPTAYAVGMAGGVPHQARHSRRDGPVNHPVPFSTQVSTPSLSGMVNSNKLSLALYSVHCADARAIDAQGQSQHAMMESATGETEAVRAFAPADPLACMTLPGEIENIPYALHATGFSGGSPLESQSLPMGENDFPYGDSSSISSSDDWEQVLAAVHDMKQVQFASNFSTPPSSISEASTVAPRPKLAVLVPDPRKGAPAVKHGEGGQVTEDERKRMRIVRNRESAERSRMKKRNAQLGLEMRIRRLAEENLALRDALDSIEPGLSTHVLAKLGKQAT